MQDILTHIIAHKRLELEQAKQCISPEELRRRISERSLPPCLSMKQALSASPTGIIAEFKRRSPSKGWISQEADPALVAPAYERGGAAALSILTDEFFFGGTLHDLHIARQYTRLPLLRKDFIIDEYQLLEARLAGADAVLLIAACLTREDCNDLTDCAHALGLEVLLEVHTPEELAYLHPQTDMLGVNNRHLGSFRTDAQHSLDMAGSLQDMTNAPTGLLRVSESGLSDPEMVIRLRKAGYRGFLIGESFMKTSTPGETLATFITKITQGNGKEIHR